MLKTLSKKMSRFVAFVLSISGQSLKLNAGNDYQQLRRKGLQGAFIVNGLAVAHIRIN
jgi:hypothetical protein